MARIVLKKDDLRPNVTATLKDANDAVVDLTSASSLKFIMTLAGASTPTFSSTAPIITPSTGSVGYTWSSGNTSTAGVYNAEFEVCWSIGVYQTVPAEDYLEVEIIEDLGGSV